MSKLDISQDFENSERNDKSSSSRLDNQEERMNTEKSVIIVKSNSQVSKREVLKKEIQKLKKFNEIDEFGYNPIPIKGNFQNAICDNLNTLQAKKSIAENYILKNEYIKPSTRFSSQTTYDKSKNSRIQNIIDQRIYIQGKECARSASKNQAKSFENLEVKQYLMGQKPKKKQSEDQVT